MTLFRVHFADGAVWDVRAESADAARAAARRWVGQHGMIVKCKVVRER